MRSASSDKVGKNEWLVPWHVSFCTLPLYLIHTLHHRINVRASKQSNALEIWNSNILTKLPCAVNILSLAISYEKMREQITCGVIDDYSASSHSARKSQAWGSMSLYGISAVVGDDRKGRCDRAMEYAISHVEKLFCQTGQEEPCTTDGTYLSSPGFRVSTEPYYASLHVLFILSLTCLSSSTSNASFSHPVLQIGGHSNFQEIMQGLTTERFLYLGLVMLIHDRSMRDGTHFFPITGSLLNHSCKLQIQNPVSGILTMSYPSHPFMYLRVWSSNHPAAGLWHNNYLL